MPEERFRLIVGLGNPGEKYRLTRHNMGFMVVDKICRVHGICLDKTWFEVVFGEGRVGGQTVMVAKPMTFMNRVGPAVRNLAAVFELETHDVFVVHDDIDLAFGRLKIIRKGGDGGHNGVKSLIGAFGSAAFARIRVGIGRPQDREDTSSYVLSGFDTEQEGLLEGVISAASEAVETVLVEGVSEAMNLFHGRTISEINVGRRL